MPLGFGGAMNAFQMGQETGAGTSPVTGLGQAIRNILDNARQKGLLETKQNLETRGAIQQNAASQQGKLDVVREQAVAQGEQARLTDAAELAGKKRASGNEDFVFEDADNPNILHVPGLPPLLRLDKEIGGKFVKTFEDVRSAGLTETPPSKIVGVRSLKQLQLEAMGKGTESIPYVINSEADIDKYDIPEGAVVRLGKQTFRLGPKE